MTEDQQQLFDALARQLDEAVEQLWLAGLEEDAILARARATLARYRSKTERHSDRPGTTLSRPIGS